MKDLLGAFVLLFACGALTSPALAEGAPVHRVPEGFLIEKAAGAPEVVFPMFGAFDERGRLFVTESSGLDLYAELKALTRKCRVSLLEDRDQDGRFETARVFAEGLVFPMGIAFRDGKLYTADPPELVALEDTDGDGRADRRTTVLQSFGHEDNGSLHGILFGPDSLLYMTSGNPDGYRFTLADGSVLTGQSGALLRAGADGSRPEVLSRGFENLVEVVFLPGGEVIGTDNWFQLPSNGGRDALVHLLEGGLYPRHLSDTGTPKPLTGVALPPVALFPAVALSGLVRYRGALFPREMRGDLFSAQHNARRVARHVLRREGSSFQAESFDFVTTDDPDFHPSDVLESADGSLLVIDTGGWYVQHCPTGKIRNSRSPGGIYRVRPRDAAAPADPWGLEVGWNDAPPSALAALLSDPRPTVRDHAQRALSGKGEAAVPHLAALLGAGGGWPAREHAAWALASLPHPSALPPLRAALASSDHDLASLAARALLRREDRTAAGDLAKLLASGAPKARLAAAEALARCGGPESLPALWKALETDPDPFLEHALVHAIHRNADQGALEAALARASPRVQKAALWLLDQAPRRGLAPEPLLARLPSPDRSLREAALRILGRHPECAGRASGVIEAWLKKRDLPPDEKLGLRELILACERVPEIEELIARSVSGRDGEIPEGSRLLVLEALTRSGRREAPPSWVEALGSAVLAPATAVRFQAARTAAVLQIAELDGPLGALAMEEGQPAEVRLEALRAVAARRPDLPDSCFELVLGRLGGEGDPLARLLAGEVLSRSRLSDAQALRLLRSLRDDPLVSPAVLLSALKRGVSEGTAREIAAYLEDSLRAGWKPREEDLRQALRSLPGGEETAGRLLGLLRESTQGERARLAALEPLLGGGSTERGRDVFLGKKAGCSACHRVGPQGGEVGPDLTRVGAVRSGRDLLESILVPSSTFAQGYESWTVVAKNGELSSGVIAYQSPEAVVLKDPSGAERRFPREGIKDLLRQETSLMPEGLERTMTREELGDLLAFLQSLR